MTDGRHRHCTKRAKTSNANKVPLSTQSSSYSWLKSSCSFCTTTALGNCPGTGTGDQGHPRCRDQSVAADDSVKGGSRLQTVMQAVSQTSRQTAASTQSSMSISVVSRVSLSRSLSLCSLATILRPYSGESVQPRSHTFPTCVVLDALSVCAIFAPCRPSKISTIQPLGMRGPKASSLIAARCSVQI